MKSHVRVAIIGGGACGVSLLYHLSKLGWNDIALIEKHELTSGSTWHAAGLCTHYGGNPTIMKLRAYSANLYKNVLQQETGEPVSFHHTGGLRITHLKDRLYEFKHAISMAKTVGTELHMVGPEEIKQLHPLAQLHGIIGGLYEPNDGDIDPSQVTHAMAKGARNNGAQIYRHAAVTAIKQKHNGEWLISTLKGEITAEIVVNAAGTWAREIGHMVGLDLPIVPMLHQYLVTESIAEVAAIKQPLPIIRDTEQSWYVRRERDGMIIGPYESNGKPWSIDNIPVEFGADLLPPDLESVEHIVANALDRIPVLQTAGIKTIINGPITFTPDGNTLVGPAYGLHNFYNLCGSSMGVMEGGGLGYLLAAWIADGVPSIDMWCLDSRRFGSFANRNYRIAKAIECYANQFGLHYPHEERPAARPGITTPIYRRLQNAGAVFGAIYGWERANWFATGKFKAEQVLSFHRTNWFKAVQAECRACMNTTGLMDLSAFSKWIVSGPDAADYLDALSANAIPQGIGKISLCHFLNNKGGIACEFTITRLTENSFYLVSAAAAERHDDQWLKQHLSPGSDVVIRNVKNKNGILALAGPSTRALLQKLTQSDLGDKNFPWMTGRHIKIAGIKVHALRLNYVGELGWELHHDMEDQIKLYDIIVKAGKSFDLKHVGAYAVNSMRLEKGYPAWGSELLANTTPLDAGLNKFLKLEGRQFIGKDAVLEQLNNGVQRKLVSLTLDSDNHDTVGNEAIMHEGRTIGIICSGSYGHRINKSIALGYVDLPYASEGTVVSVDMLGNFISSETHTTPIYDPSSHRR